MTIFHWIVGGGNLLWEFVSFTRNFLPVDVVALKILGSFKRAIRCCLHEKLFHIVQLVLLLYFVWLILFVCPAFFFYYFCLYKFIFFSIKLFIIKSNCFVYLLFYLYFRLIYNIWVTVLYVFMHWQEIINAPTLTMR